MAISFRNTSYENKLSKVVKSIDRWVMNTLKHKKKNEEVFHCNDIALIMSEICSISRRPCTLPIARKDPCFVWFSVFFYRPSHQTPILNMIFEECKKLPDFSVVSKNSLRKWCRKLEFCYERGNRKIPVYQRFDVDVLCL